MIPVTILFFLVGAVLAWRFRVWILVPVTLLAMIAIMMFELARGAGLVTASGYGLLLGPAPQLGYAIGLLARNALANVGCQWQKRLASARADRRGLQAMFATEKKDFLLEKADNKSQII